MAQAVFNRYEKKYLLTETQYTELLERIKPYVREDKYKEYEIRNIYFDNETNELIRTSIEKPVYKEKFRIRCYGMPSENSKVFLEIKKKYDGLVNKRRITLPYKEAAEFLKGNTVETVNPQISKEIEYIIKHYNLKPKMYLAYNRMAYQGINDNTFRLTFDINIRSRLKDLSLENDDEVEYLLNKGQYLMEVKVEGALPLWFVSILTDMNIRNTSFSKYGLFYKKYCNEGYYH